MTLPTTSGTERSARNQAVSVSVLETTRPATATAVAGAVTLNQGSGQLISETGLSTAAAGFYVMTLSNSLIDVNTMVFASAHLSGGTSTTGTPSIASVEISAGQAVISVKNVAASAAFNGSIGVDFFLVRKSGASL